MKPEGIVIYHKQGNVLFKKTLEKDEEHKARGRRNRWKLGTVSSQKRNAKEVQQHRWKVRATRYFLPLKLKDTQLLDKKPKTLYEPVFPTYMFIRMGDQDDWNPITKTPGFDKLVKLSRDENGFMAPTPVPDSVIEELQSLEYVKTDYKQGDQVRVKEGTFKDFNGLIDSTDGESRVYVLLEFFNSQKKIKLKRSNIVPIWLDKFLKVRYYAF